METLFSNIDNLVRIAIYQGKIPRYLYKYRGIKETKMILQKGTIYFSTLNQFNDPFEGKAIIKDNYSIKDWESFLQKNSSIPSDLISSEAKKIKENPESINIIADIIQKELSNIGFYCLTKKPDNHLMWTHYSNEHKGCVVEFDLLKCLPIFQMISKVNYSMRFISYNYLRDNTGPYRTITHKSREWEYEEEYRIMSYNKGIIPLPEDAISSIIFGCRTIKRNKTIIKNLAKSSIFHNISFKQAQLNPKSYKIDIV